MKKFAMLLFLIVALLLALPGCAFKPVDELYTQPKPPEDYLKLQRKIEEVMGQNPEYAPPLTGELIQQVQLHDLDGDGVKEAIAFFRVSADEKPLKIYIFRQMGEEYMVDTVIESAGSAINAVYYENLDEGADKEIVVSWQMYEKVHSLAAYSIGHNQVELMRTDYADFKIIDLDGDHQKEIAVLQSTPIPGMEGTGRLELYNCRENVFELESAAPLSENTTGLVDSGVRTGYLRDMVPAIFVASSYGENGRITDIFAYRNDRLENITLAPEQRESTQTIRWYTQVSGMDINGDRILELPDPYELPDPKRTSAAVNFWGVRWRQYDISGTAWPVFTTYLNDKDGWCFILPDAWEGKISLSRSDLAGGGERAVVFSYWEKDSGEEPMPFLTVYKLTGNKRLERAEQTGRFRLMPEQAEDAATIYVAKLEESLWDSGLDEQTVRESFFLLPTLSLSDT